MRITVRSGDTSLRIPIPTALILNNFTAGLVPQFMAQNGVTITKKQARKLVRAIRDSKRRLGNWVLVEAQTANGDYVEIKL